MWWIVGMVAGGLLMLFGFGREWKRRRGWDARLDQLIQSPPGTGPVDPHATAEAHFLRGCAVLESRQPAAGVRHFQLAHHGDYAYEMAAILTFTCMKMSPEEMPQLLRIFIQTLREVSRSRIPSCSRENAFLTRIAALTDAPPPAGLSAYGTMCWRLPIAPLRTQLLAAREANFEWAAELFSESKSAPAVAAAPA